MQSEALLSGLYDWYQFRMHTELSKEEVQSGMELLDLHMYIASFEVEANRSHWQMAIGIQKITKDQLRKLLLLQFGCGGRNNYSLSRMRKSLKQLSTYLLKEGNYFYKGIPKIDIENLQKLTFKNSTKNKARFYELDDKYLLDPEMTHCDYIREFDDLKIEMRQHYRQNNMFEHLDMLRARKEKTYRRRRQNKMIADYENYFLASN